MKMKSWKCYGKNMTVAVADLSRINWSRKILLFLLSFLLFPVSSVILKKTFQLRADTQLYEKMNGRKGPKESVFLYLTKGKHFPFLTLLF
jgi:hypothetical protein